MLLNPRIGPQAYNPGKELKEGHENDSSDLRPETNGLEVETKVTRTRTGHFLVAKMQEENDNPHRAGYTH